MIGAAVPAEGAAIVRDGRPIGRVTSSKWSPTLGKADRARAGSPAEDAVEDGPLVVRLGDRARGVDGTGRRAHRRPSTTLPASGCAHDRRAADPGPSGEARSKPSMRCSARAGSPTPSAGPMAYGADGGAEAAAVDGRRRSRRDRAVRGVAAAWPRRALAAAGRVGGGRRRRRRSGESWRSARPPPRRRPGSSGRTKSSLRRPRSSGGSLDSADRSAWPATTSRSIEMTGARTSLRLAGPSAPSILRGAVRRPTRRPRPSPRRAIAPGAAGGRPRVPRPATTWAVTPATRSWSRATRRVRVGRDRWTIGAPHGLDAGRTSSARGEARDDRPAAALAGPAHARAQGRATTS